jgi:hypothetical protein
MELGLLVEVPMFFLAVFFASRKSRKQSPGLKKRLQIVGLAVVLYIPFTIGLDLTATLVNRLKWSMYGSSSYNVTQKIVVYGPSAGQRRLQVKNGLIVSSTRLECSNCKVADLRDDLYRKDGFMGLSFVDPIQEAFEYAQGCSIMRPFAWIILAFCAVEYEPYYGYVQNISSVFLIGTDGYFESTLSDLEPIP